MAAARAHSAAGDVTQALRPCFSPPCPRSPRSFLPSSRLLPYVLRPCDPAASPVSCRSPTAMPPLPLRLGSICLGRTRHHRSSLPCSAVPVKHPRRAFTLLSHISYADGALLWALHAPASSSSPPLSVAMHGCWSLSHFAIALRPCIPALRSPLIIQPIRAPCMTQRRLLGQATATTATGTKTDRGEWAGRCSDSVGGLLS